MTSPAQLRKERIAKLIVACGQQDMTPAQAAASCRRSWDVTPETARDYVESPRRDGRLRVDGDGYLRPTSRARPQARLATGSDGGDRLGALEAEVERLRREVDELREQVEGVPDDR